MMLQDRSRPLPFQITLALITLALVAVAIVAGFAYLAVSRADETALERQRTFVRHGLAEQIAAIPREQENVTLWDDAVVMAKADDQQWMEENLGAWMNEYFGHDRTYILNERNELVHAARDGATVAPAGYAEDRSAVERLATSFRDEMRELSDDAEDSTEALTEAGLMEVGMVEGRPAIVSIKPILPSSDRLAQAPGTEYLHATIQFIDDKPVGRIASQYLLEDVRFALERPADSAFASIAVVDASQAPIGYVVWRRDMPGLTVMRQVAPAMVVGLLIGIGMLAFLTRRLRRASAQLHENEVHARYLAYHDTLTGLPNRAHFEERLEIALASVRQGKGKVALLYLDLDRFKNVNDTLGHRAGDDLVSQAAGRLRTALREQDSVARIGGDEFAIVISGTASLAAAIQLSERLLHELTLPFIVGTDRVFIGVSIGIAVAPDVASDRDELRRKADIALYEAKRHGRGRYQVFADDMDDLLKQRRVVEADLRAALANGDEFRLVYQPLFAAGGRKVIGAEALLRWDHPVHGKLSPEFFIGIAEEYGMILQLGDWVLREACRMAKEVPVPWIAINVSPLQLRDEHFADRCLDLIEEMQVEPSRIQIEITEAVLIENPELTAASLQKLRAAGVRVALDDFGTGYSSMSYLRNYAVDKLKIDRSFVRTLAESSDSRAIVRAMVDLALALNIQVTAEGVETTEQRDVLFTLGCQEMQGYLFSRPIGADEFKRSYMEYPRDVPLRA